jgi:hypothetical protein
MCPNAVCCAPLSLGREGRSSLFECSLASVERGGTAAAAGWLSLLEAAARESNRGSPSIASKARSP